MLEDKICLIVRKNEQYIKQKHILPKKTEASAYRKTESAFFVHEKDQIPRRKILILVDRAFSISVKAYLKPVTRWT